MAWSAVATAQYTWQNRRLTTLRWSARERRWHHRWPQGRVIDTMWWRSPEAWATHGGMYDMDDLLWRRYRPGPGDVVVDVGAGNGGETFSLSPMVGPAGRVIAVEAAPLPFQRLQELCRINGWRNVECQHVALGAESGTVSISDSEDWIVGNVYEAGGVEVRAVTLDELCVELGVDHIGWLKMNIEGAEKDAVRGMAQMAPHISHLTISCHDFLGTEWGRSREQVMASLLALGFSVERHEGDDPVFNNYFYAWH
jgi:FkbM family methyltransferase